MRILDPNQKSREEKSQVYRCAAALDRTQYLNRKLETSNNVEKMDVVDTILEK